VDRRLADLLQQFELERLEVNLFRGESRDIGSPQVFGGQVLGQALLAAYSTIDDLRVHSLHAYFLRRGDFNLPIVYQVDRSRDGHSFSSRRVIAIQNGAQIFTFSASFQRPEEGLEHQISMPAVEMRPVEPIDFLSPRPRPPVEHIWFKVCDRLPDDHRLHACLLAYMSDFSLLSTATQPHAGEFSVDELTMASIDHAMWFHREVRADEWLLYSIDSPSASGSRGFARGSVFSREGVLVASTAQEGLMRVGAPRRKAQ
jgi:acyl-CoA thioesterase-2